MTTTATRIVTPEAVELELETAGMASRVLAALIDLIGLMVVLYGVTIVASVAFNLVTSVNPDETSTTVAAVVLIFGTFVTVLGWPVGWEIATRGRSLGKMALGLRVVTTEGGPCQVRHAIIRGLLGVVEILLTFGSVALMVALGSRGFRRLGDHMAGTIVVRERGGSVLAAHPRRWQPYYGWEAWAASLDTSRLDADDYRLVRSYLVRQSALPLEARHRLGRQILARVLPHVGHEAQAVDTLAQWGADAPLTAVAAAYQRRFD